jgi:carbon-monoxide dehydrogenase medium subunit
VRGSFAYLRPRTIDEALDFKSRTENSRYIAGGTDLLVRMKEHREDPSALISLRRVAGLSDVHVDRVHADRVHADRVHAARIRLGTATTIADCLANSALTSCLPVLAQAMSRMGSVQIRNTATVGGNLCTASPCADTAPPLLVLGARLAFRNPTSGREEEVPLDQFFIAPRQTRLGANDLATALIIDAPSPSARTVFFKKTRVQMDLALASVAVLLELDGKRCVSVRVAAGSVAPTPRRLEAVERLLTGEILTPEILRHAEQLARDSVAPICDLRAGDDYRRHVTGVYVRRAIELLLAGNES